MKKSFIERFITYKDSNNPALVCGDHAVTYKQLYRKASCLASFLRSKGVGKQSTAVDAYDLFQPYEAKNSPWVVIQAPRSINAVIGVIATLLAGGAYVLISDDAPREYVENIIHDTNAAVFLDGHLDLSHKPIAGRLPLPGEIACAIFTSGSTGRPKGAVLEHKVIAEMLDWQINYMKPKETMQTAAYAPFSFIANIWEMYFPLASGQTLHILQDSVRHDLYSLERYIEENDISYLFLPPDVAELFTKIYKGKALKYLRVAGGRLNSCGDIKGRYEVLYSLGMSENGGCVTFKSLTEAVSGMIPIGKPFADTKVFLVGDEGEMAISGPSLFRGYIGDKEQTDEVFVKNPYEDNAPYGVMYLSGDLAEFNGDHELVHCGRADWVIKIRNMRVDPLHVEAVLSACDGVAECAVCPREVRGEPALIAWYVGGNENIIHAALADRLPEYMIPSLLVRIEKLPRNINGKIDRKALIYDAASHSKSGGSFFTDPEKNIARLFADVLNINMAEVARDDSFFDLGGNSLKLMDLQVRLNTKFKCGASYLDLFQAPTVNGITKLMNCERTQETIPQAPIMEQYPLSPQMRQMWLLWRTGQDKGRYTLNTSARIKGDFDIKRAEEAFSRIVLQNRILRTYFMEKDGDVFVRLAETAEVTLREKPPITFDLSKPPLYAISYSDQVLTISVHHSLADAYSMRLITESFWRLYIGEKPIQSEVDALDIAVYERNKKRLDTDFWSGLFDGGVPMLKLPYDYPRSRKPSEVHEINLFPAKNKTVSSLLKKYGVTAYVLCLTAFGAALADVCGTDEVVIGVPFSGRNHPDTLNTVGMLVNTLPVPVLAGNRQFSEIVALTNKRFLDVFKQQDTSTEALSNYLRKNGSLKHPGLYTVSVNSRTRPMTVDDVRDLDITVLPGGYGRAVFDLILDVRDGDEVVLCYAKELFREETIVKIAEAIMKYIFIDEVNNYVEKQRKKSTFISMEASI